jgi:WD40 repeat protein
MYILLQRVVGLVLLMSVVGYAVAQDTTELDVITAENAAQLEEIQRWEPLEEFIRAVKFNPSGTLMALVREGGVIELIDLDTYEVVQTLEGYDEDNTWMKFSADGTKLMMWSQSDGFVYRVWEVETGSELGSVEVGYAPGGEDAALTTIWVADFPFSIRDLVTGEVRVEIFDDMAFYPSPKLNGDGTHLLGLGYGNQMWLWDTTTGEVLMQFAPAEDNIKIEWFDFAPDGTQVWQSFTVLDADGNSGTSKFAFFDVETGEVANVLTPEYETLYFRLNYLPDGERVWFNAPREEGEGVWIYDLTTGEMLLEAITTGATGAGMARFSPDSALAVIMGGPSEEAQIWNLASETPEAITTLPVGGALDGQFTSDGRKLVLVGYEGVSVWGVPR